MRKVNRILFDEAYCLYLQKNKDLEENRLFCRHGFEHLLAVARLTYLLLLEEGCRFISKEMAYSAGLLHDIGRWKEYDIGGDHAGYSAALAGPILDRAGFSLSEQELILKAISQHRHGLPDEHCSPLSAALRKADAMDRLCFSCASREGCRSLERQPQRDQLIY